MAREPVAVVVAFTRSASMEGSIDAERGTAKAAKAKAAA
jgi:hypothetical protein